MTVRSPRKFVSAPEKRLGRALSTQEALGLVAYARAVKNRQTQQRQQRVYKPRMELWDDGDSPVITAVFEVPGLHPENITLDIIDDLLVVSGERRQRDLSRGPKTTVVGTFTPSKPQSQSSDRGSKTTLTRAATLDVRELKYGIFHRVVSVTAGCTMTDIQAIMENGMLMVSWPRDIHLSGGKSESSALGLDIGTAHGDNSSACV